MFRMRRGAPKEELKQMQRNQNPLESSQQQQPLALQFEQTRLKLAVVGCGKFGGKRLEACRKADDSIDLRAVVDSDAARAEIAGAKYGVRHSSDLEAVLSDPEIEAVIIAVPNNLHAPLAIQALDAGKHVMVEKPLAVRPEQAEQIVQAADRNERFVKTASNHRFFPPVIKAHELYSQGLIGQALSFRGAIGNNGSLTRDSWFWKKEIAGGGTMIDNACHLLDIARMFMGGFTQCLGQVANLYWKEAEVEDYATGIFVADDGRQALITSSWTQWTGYFYFELWGDEGYIFVDSRGCDKVTVGDNRNGLVRTFDFGGFPISSHQDELRYFAQCIRTNQPPVPSARDGREVIKMIDGVYRSTEDKVWVSLAI